MNIQYFYQKRDFGKEDVLERKNTNESEAYNKNQAELRRKREKELRLKDISEKRKVNILIF